MSTEAPVLENTAPAAPLTAVAAPTETLPVGPLSRGVKLSYGLPAFVGAAMTIPILVHMPKFYSDVVLLPASSLAIAMALGRAFDAIVDPAIGWMSDRTKSRWGRRRPFMLVGAILAAISFYLLCVPPAGVTGSAAVPWFAVSFWAYFFFHSIYEIPYLSLGSELSTETWERSILFAWRSGFLVLGTIIASVLPSVLAFVFQGDERQVFVVVGITYAVLLVLLYGQLVVKVKERPEFMGQGETPIVPGVRRALRNGPFRTLLWTSVIYSIPSAIPSLLLPYYIAYVLQPPNPTAWLGIFLLLYLGSGFLALPLWIYLVRKIGKLNCWIVCGMIGVVGGGSLFFVGKGDTTLVAIIEALVGIQFGAFFFLAPAMVSDIIDYDEFYSGKRTEAQYHAFLQMVPKFTAIPGASIPLAVLASMGYVPNQVQSAPVQMTIRVLFALVPAAFNLLALFFLWKYPLSEKAHAGIRDGIWAHTNGQDALDPITGRTVAPARAAKVDDKTAWFLDHFSKAELRTSLESGAAGIRRSVLLALAGTTALTVVSGLTYRWFVSAAHEGEPGPGAVIALAIGGFALSGAVFHAVRLHAVGRFAANPIAPAVVRDHLETQTT